MKIYLIRHGESQWNSLHMIQGSCNPGLSSRGIRQAERIAARCAQHTFAGIYASPLIRARETAEIIARHQEQEPKVVQELAECNFGDLQGKTFSEAMKIYPNFMLKWKTDPESLGVKNFEPLGSFRERVVNIFNRILAENPEDQPIALVTHGGVISAVINYILDANPKSMTRAICSNASLTILESKPGWIELIAFNDTQHLEGRAQ